MLCQKPSQNLCDPPSQNTQGQFPVTWRHHEPCRWVAVAVGLEGKTDGEAWVLQSMALSAKTMTPIWNLLECSSDRCGVVIACDHKLPKGNVMKPVPDREGSMG